jgi:nucleotide-binding universal stress UspA family protein
MSDHRPCSRIVVGVADPDSSQAALHWAVDEARRRGALVEAVHALGVPTSAEPSGTFTDWKIQAQETVDRCLDRLADHPGIMVQGRVVEGRPGQVLVAEAGDPDTILLVLGSGRRSGVARLLLGSTTETCARHSVCPVVVVPTPHALDRAWALPNCAARESV